MGRPGGQVATRRGDARRAATYPSETARPQAIGDATPGASDRGGGGGGAAQTPARVGSPRRSGDRAAVSGLGSRAPVWTGERGILCRCAGWAAPDDGQVPLLVGAKSPPRGSRLNSERPMASRSAQRPTRRGSAGRVGSCPDRIGKRSRFTDPACSSGRLSRSAAAAGSTARRPPLVDKLPSVASGSTARRFVPAHVDKLPHVDLLREASELAHREVSPGSHPAGGITGNHAWEPHTPRAFRREWSSSTPRATSGGG